jgi:hypothetical protein
MKENDTKYNFLIQSATVTAFPFFDHAALCKSIVVKPFPKLEKPGKLNSIRVHLYLIIVSFCERNLALIVSRKISSMYKTELIEKLQNSSSA